MELAAGLRVVEEKYKNTTIEFGISLARLRAVIFFSDPNILRKPSQRPLPERRWRASQKTEAVLNS